MLCVKTKGSSGRCRLARSEWNLHSPLLHHCLVMSLYTQLWDGKSQNKLVWCHTHTHTYTHTYTNTTHTYIRTHIHKHTHTHTRTHTHKHTHIHTHTHTLTISRWNCEVAMDVMTSLAASLNSITSMKV